MKRAILTLSLFIVTWLTACGQTGDLYLPGKDTGHQHDKEKYTFY